MRPYGHAAALARHGHGELAANVTAMAARDQTEPLDAEDLRTFIDVARAGQQLRQLTARSPATPQLDCPALPRAVP